jgi:hypothetical protein
MLGLWGRDHDDHGGLVSSEEDHDIQYLLVHCFGKGGRDIRYICSFS